MNRFIQLNFLPMLHIDFLNFYSTAVELQIKYFCMH